MEVVAAQAFHIMCPVQVPASFREETWCFASDKIRKQCTTAENCAPVHTPASFQKETWCFAR